jgi:hypothetical protein
VAVLAVAGAVAFPGSVSADERLALAGAETDTCHARSRTPGPAVARRSLIMPATGWVTARLGGRRGDWDLAIFERRSGRLVAASAQSGLAEVASGVAVRGELLDVQACRLGGARTALLDTTTAAVDVSGPAPRPQLVHVLTPDLAARRTLALLGMDLAEHGGRGFAAAVLHGAEDRAKLARAGLRTRVVVPDLLRRDAGFRARDAAYAQRVDESLLPSGRTNYRRLADYSADMKRLARENPGLVRSITLPEKTFEGRPVEGIEISRDVGRRDGKPTFVQLGVHHAREWPSGEHAIEWAFELVEGYRKGSRRARKVLESTRTVVVPVVNPDGFNTSREAGEQQGAGTGRGAPLGGDTETINILTHLNEYRRKNCRLASGAEQGDCTQTSFGLFEPGVDPNRNYAGSWGGPGASTDGLAQNYRGPGPFSEPETRNVRALVSTRQVTGLITNHTFSNLVLRPPGLQANGLTPDEGIYKALGDAMAHENGYTSQLSYELYDTSGTTEDWSYYATGGLGFTFEIGPTAFHPPFANVVAEWRGTTPAADHDGDPGGGNRAAYYHAAEHAAASSRHSRITGTAPAGATLRLRKRFTSRTAPVLDASGSAGRPLSFTDTLETRLTVPANGRFAWHVNPSARPGVGASTNRPAHGTPSPPQTFGTNGPAATVPCLNSENPPPRCYEDHVITVPAGPGIDNYRMTVEIEWPTAVSDWDFQLLRADAAGNAVGSPLRESASGPTFTTESVTLGEPELTPGKYVVRVINWLAIAAIDPWQGRVTFAGPPAAPGEAPESWELTCEGIRGKVGARNAVRVARGGVAKLDLLRCAKVAGSCAPARGGVTARAIWKARLGRTPSAQRRALPYRRATRRGRDRFCVAGGGALVSHYARAGKTRRAGAVTSSSRRHRLRGVRPGARPAVLLARVRGERRLAGCKGWHVAAGSRGRLLFAIRGGRVRAVGVAPPARTLAERRLRRLLCGR